MSPLADREACLEGRSHCPLVPDLNRHPRCKRWAIALVCQLWALQGICNCQTFEPSRFCVTSAARGKRHTCAQFRSLCTNSCFSRCPYLCMENGLITGYCLGRMPANLRIKRVDSHPHKTVLRIICVWKVQMRIPRSQFLSCSVISPASPKPALSDKLFLPLINYFASSTGKHLHKDKGNERLTVRRAQQPERSPGEVACPCNCGFQMTP